MGKGMRNKLARKQIYKSNANYEKSYRDRTYKTQDNNQIVSDVRRRAYQLLKKREL